MRPLNKPIIGYDNLLTLYNVYAGTGTDPQNAYDWATNTKWIANDTNFIAVTNISVGEKVNYLALGANTLSDVAGSIKLEWYDGFIWQAVLGAEIIPTDHKPTIVFFNTCEHIQYRVIVSTNGSPASISLVSFGEFLEFPIGIQNDFGSPEFAPQDKKYQSTSESGEIVGMTTIRSGVGDTISIMHLKRDWVRAKFLPFQIHTRTGGFFFVWCHAQAPNDVAYCLSNETPRAQYTRGGYASVSIPYKGVRE